MKAVFLRALRADDKAAVMRAAICNPDGARGTQRFEVDVARFTAVPRSPFAYWVSERLRRLFTELQSFDADGRTVKQGLATADDFRFVRGWWAVQPYQIGARWFSYTKGGKFSPFYADVPSMVNWEHNGSEIKNNLNERGGIRSNVWMLRDTASNYFFRPGLTWPLRGVRFSAQVVPEGCIFSVAGKMAFVAREDLAWFSALFNSRSFDSFIAFFAGKIGGVQYEVGLIQNVPVPSLASGSESNLADLARRAWSLKRSLDTRIETSHAFVLPALLQIGGDTLAARANAWAERVRALEAELLEIQAEIDERCFRLYGIDEVDRRAITEGLGGSPDGPGDAEEAAAEADVETDDEGDAEAGSDAAGLAAELVSWAVGVAFGRFDVRLATGARVLPAEPEPFDPLPVCSPGMLTGDDGLPLTAAPSGYPLAFPGSGVLVDDPGDPRDLTAAVHAVFETVFGASADAFWQEAAELLDPRGHDLRGWLGSGLFEHHLKLHSKSRRKAPILWQLGTPSGRYSAWLYAHRLTADSFFQLQSDVVAPKLAYEERKLTALAQSSEGSPSAKERREIATQEAFVEELRALLEEVTRVAPLWKPTLDDGVVLVMATLWRAVPHKPWQRELKAKWAELAAGRYDWAHLAMHLWPERVVPKCAADRSLAIAHRLEDVLWEQDTDGEWAARAVDQPEVNRLIAERTSAAVKDALHNLISAPAPSSGALSRRSRGANGQAVS